jgi:S1-C subfamily serine protease
MVLTLHARVALQQVKTGRITIMHHSDTNSGSITPYPSPQPSPSSLNTKTSSGRFNALSRLVLALVLILVFGIGLFAGWTFGRGGALSSVQPSPTPAALSEDQVALLREAVLAKVQPSVVQVNVTLAQGAGIGSGVIIDKRGYIVTNNHVIAGAQRIEVVLLDGTKLTAQLVGTDPASDLAVLKITSPTTLTIATFGDSSQLHVGHDVLVIGNPLGITQTVTHGIISALNRRVSEGKGEATISDAIQTDAPINPGNSGGAMVDLQGNLIGIPTLAAIDPEFNTPANGVGFAIPSNHVQRTVSQIIASWQGS